MKKLKDAIVEGHKGQFDFSDLTSVGIANSDETVGRFAKSLIKVESPSGAALDQFPSRMEGVRIAKEQREDDRKPFACSDQNGNFAPVPGGVVCGDVDSIATTTCKVWDWNNNPGMLTCAHLFTDVGCVDLTGEVGRQNGDRMGEIPSTDHHNIYDDWAFIDKNNNNTNGYNSVIEDQGDVVGYTSRDGLNTLKSTSTTIHQLGRTTCRTDGDISQIDKAFTYAQGCYDTDWAVSTDIHAEGGDSGGPIYDRWYDSSEYKYKNSIIAPLWGGEDGTADYSQGTAAYRIVDKANLKFTPP